MKQLVKLLKKSTKDSRVTLVAGMLLGALTNVYPVQAAVIFLVLMLILFVNAFADEHRSLKKLGILEKEISHLLSPSQDALDAVDKANKNYLVAGNFIETVPHPNLNTEIRAIDAGWDPSEIVIEYMDKKFNSKAVLALAGGINEFDPPNGIKYCLAASPFVTEESPLLKLVLNETDYFTVLTSKEFLSTHPKYLPELGSVVPEESQIPSSLCLHYIIRTADESLLCIKRSRGMAYHDGLWSITGEEQLAEHEVGKQAPIEKLFKRALCEEIFQLRNISIIHEVLPLLEKDLSFLRILSIGLELPLYNPTIIGIAQLSIDPSELRQRLINRKRSIVHHSGDDDEGDFFVLSKSEAIKLLKDGAASVTGLFNQQAEEITADLLHPTSRYRLFRVLRTTLRTSFETGIKL